MCKYTHTHAYVIIRYEVLLLDYTRLRADGQIHRQTIKQTQMMLIALVSSLQAEIERFLCNTCLHVYLYALYVCMYGCMSDHNNDNDDNVAVVAAVVVVTINIETGTDRKYI